MTVRRARKPTPRSACQRGNAAWLALMGVAVLLGHSGWVQAQMPDLRQMMGKPLPVPDLPSGTVTVRVSRKLPMNSAPGIKVHAVITVGATPAEKTITTGPDGRATFSELPASAQFHADATVDGEVLTSATFSIPDHGGVRVLLISGLGGPASHATGSAESAAPDDAGSGGDGSSAAEGFALAAMTGTVEPAPGTPQGTLDIEVLDRSRQPLSNQTVLVGQVGPDRQLKGLKGITDERGVAHFKNLTVANMGYVAVTTIAGFKVGTQPFRLAPETGMHARIQALDTTTDPSGLTLDRSSKLAFEPREDAIAVYEMLSFRNASGKLFDPGTGGLLIPLPKGFMNAQPLGEGPTLEVRAKEGMLLRSPIPPSGALGTGLQVKFAFFLPAEGESTVTFHQPLPYGIERPLLIVPANSRLTLESDGLSKQPDESDRQGNSMHLFEMPDVAQGGVLSLTIRGLPAQNRTGHRVAGALALLLMAIGTAAAARPTGRQRNHADVRVALLDRREKLFGELVDHEARKPDPDQPGLAAWTQRRRELVGKLESVYRDLSVEEQRQEASV